MLSSEADFTTEMYRKSLVEAKSRWRFIPFTLFDSPGRAILWRHDVDVSVHRAYRLAEIEAEEGIKSTYFFMLHSAFYNLLSPGVLCKARSIVAMGHYAGLHFDPSIYEGKLNSIDALCESLSFEKQILEHCLNTRIEAFSWHNPTKGNCLTMDGSSYAGMINAYGADLRRRYRYVSDSNGVWRHDRLHDVVKTQNTEKLHVLTHPEWWQESPMPPRYRIYRSAIGCAKSSIYANDRLLSAFGRENIAGSAHSIQFLQNANRSLFELFDFLWNDGHLTTLYAELWRLHNSQINRLCKAVLCKDWHVPENEINTFFENSGSAVDALQLFYGVFELRLDDIPGIEISVYSECVVFRNRLLHAETEISKSRLEEVCVSLSEIINSLAAWGRTRSINYDGLQPLCPCDTQLSTIVERSVSCGLEELAGKMPDASMKKWERFKGLMTGVSASPVIT